MIKRLFISIVLGILACATTELPHVGEMTSFHLQEDERRMWNRSTEEQKKIDNSNYLYDGPALTAYVNDVAQSLVPENIKEKGLSFQIRIIKNPFLNSFSYPNGVIYIHTGILCKMQNEAQLATLLGHEMTHVIYRHGIENYRSFKNSSAVFTTAQVAFIPFGVYGSMVNVLGSIGTMASVTGYSRELETEADKVGLELMVKAGYDPKEAVRLFEYLKIEVEEQEIKEPYFFGSHPRLQERINNYTQSINVIYPDKKGHKYEDKFMTKISPVLLENALLDLSMGRFSSAQNGIIRFLQIEPRNAKAHYCMGELYRIKGEKDDRQKAIEKYNTAISCDSTYPSPHKRLGMIFYKQKLYEMSQQEFEEYLFLYPEAEDRGYIEQYIQRLKIKLQEADK